MGSSPSKSYRTSVSDGDSPSRPLPSSVSTGTNEAAIEDGFVESVLKGNPIPLKNQLIEIQIVYGRRKKRLSTWMGPDTLVHTTSDGRIIGKERAFLAAYLIKIDGNGCALRFPEYCVMGDRPFENPSHADFDHIDADHKDRKVGNFRMACAPCNRHAMSMQMKLIREVASSTREREMLARPHLVDPLPTSRETAWSHEMFPGAVKVLFCRDGYLSKPGDHRPKKWLIGILPEKVGKGRATTFAKYVNDEFVPQGYLTEQDYQTEQGKETHLVRTTKPADKLIERELGTKPKEVKTS